MSTNVAFLIGRLGKDPTFKDLGNNNSVCGFHMATSEKWVDKDGNENERTDWHSVSVFGKKAELCAKFLKKGSQVAVQGKIKYSEYENQEGVKQHQCNIIADKVEFVG